MTIDDLRFGYELELKPRIDRDDVTFDRMRRTDSMGIYNHMYENGWSIDMHWDNSPIFEMKTSGAMTFDEMVEHFITLTTYIRHKFVVHQQGGIHMHISMKDNRIYEYDKNIVSQYIQFEKYIYQMCSYTKCSDGTIRHRYNGYCNSVSEIRYRDSIRNLTHELYGSGYGLNFNEGHETIEFRMVDSGFNVDRFKSIATMLAHLILYSYNKTYNNYYDDDNLYIPNSEQRYDIGKVKEFLETIGIPDGKIKTKLLKLYKYAFKKAKVLAIA